MTFILALSLVWIVWQVSCNPSYVPLGDQINIQVSLDDGTTLFLTAIGQEIFTTSNKSSAQAFIIDSGTGYLFFPSADTDDYSSGYGLPTVVNTTGVTALFGVDGSSYVYDKPAGQFGIRCE